MRAVFLATWVFSLLGLVLPDYEPFAGLLVALYFVARTCPWRAAVAALFACSVPIIVNTANVVMTKPDSNLDHLGLSLFIGSAWVAMYVGVWLVGRKHRAGIKAAAADAQARAQEEAEAALRDERLRLARELHDIVAHSVSAIVLQAAGAKALAAAAPQAGEAGERDERVAGALEAIESTGVQTMRELHRLLGLLRAAAGDSQAAGDPSESSLAYLDRLIEVTRRSGIDVELDTLGEPRPLDPSVDLSAYRMIQESLANVMKHAGRGARAEITLAWHPEILDVTVRSVSGTPPDGVRPPVIASSGLGLRGLRERIEAVGGRFDAGVIAGGYLTHAHLPLGSMHPSARSSGD